MEVMMKQTDCEIVLAGDFNARTGNHNNIIKEKNPNLDDDLCRSGPDMRSKTHRVSSDQIINERGKYFLDLLEIANLTALNGSTVGDCLGEYTCLEYNGASIPDYIPYRTLFGRT